KIRSAHKRRTAHIRSAHTPSGPPCLSSGGPGSIIGVSTAEGKTRSQEEWVWWACRMVSCDLVPGRQRLVQICRRRFYLRGVEASTAPPSSVKFPGCEGMFFLTSPAVESLTSVYSLRVEEGKASMIAVLLVGSPACFEFRRS
ncbi:hypothetical protein HID58_074954, partial [Brassica napus]